MRSLSKRYLIIALFLTVTVPGHVIAADGFVENSEEMVQQMLGGEKKFGASRSFVVVESESRAIAVRKKNATGEEETVIVNVPVTGVDPAVRLKVEFEVDSARLRPEAYKLLTELGKALKDERVIDHRVCIKGHTDSDGEDKYNLGLSYDRAHAVQNYLQGAFGLPGDRITVFGYGEAMPLAANVNSYNKQLNRRVEVSLNCSELQ